MNEQHIPSMEPGSLDEVKQFVTQFASFLPEEKRNAIFLAISAVESTGGIQDEKQGEYILQNLLQSLGLSGKNQ